VLSALTSLVGHNLRSGEFCRTSWQCWFRRPGLNAAGVPSTLQPPSSETRFLHICVQLSYE